MLYLVTWLTDFALLLFVFTGTRFLAEQGTSPLLLGVLGASLFLSSAISSACSGGIADRVGRRRVALIGMALLVLNLAGFAVCAPEGRSFYFAWSAAGISAGQIYPAIAAWLGHNRSGRSESRAYLWFCLSFNAGILSAQLTGGWLYESHGIRAALMVATGLALAGLVCLLLLREPETHRECSSSLNETSSLSTSRAFARLTWLANFAGMFSVSTLWFLFPDLVVSLKIPPGTHGLVLAVGRVVVMSTYCVMYLLTFWQYRFSIMVIVQVIGAAGLLVISLAHSALGLACGVAALSALTGYNYFASLFYSASGNRQERKGRAFGLNEAFLSLGATAGSLFGGVASTVLGDRAPFRIAALLVITLLLTQTVAWWRLRRPLRSPLNSTQDEPSAEPATGVEIA